MKRIRITLAVFFICFGLFILWKSNLFQGDSSGNSNENQPTFSKYYNGNYKDAYNKLLPEAENGDAVAQVSLGNLYSAGLGVEQSYREAYYWYKKAADQGNSNGLLNLGTMYDKGYYVRQEYSKTIELYKQAVSIDGNPMAKYNLSIMFLNGKGIKKNYKMGINLLKQSVEQKNTNAMLKLGLAYLKGEYQLPVDEKKAFELFRKAAELGDPMGQSNLAAAYHLGKGVDKDDFQAYKWFYISANYGNDDLAKDLINIYKFNLTDSQKQKVISEAKKWMNNNQEINQNLIDANYKSSN